MRNSSSARRLRCATTISSTLRGMSCTPRSKGSWTPMAPARAPPTRSLYVSSEEVDDNEDHDQLQTTPERHDVQARRSCSRPSSAVTTPRMGRRSSLLFHFFVNNATGGSRERLRQRSCDRTGSGGPRVILAAAPFDRLRCHKN